MSLFVVKHQHSAETCPAGDTQMGPMLAQYVSAANADKFGVRLHGEGVINGGHTLYLILDAQEQDKVEEYMAPFSQFGSVEVLPASHCEQVVARGAC
ncbi:MAG TPA: DUF3303 family protein [Actinomycetota bacterium]|nr:DUF3303 family protein [Actinomycetota bacterium]